MRSRNDINIETKNEIKGISFEMRKLSKEIIERADEISYLIEYYNSLQNLTGEEEDILFNLDIMKDKIEDAAYKLEKI